MLIKKTIYNYLDSLYPDLYYYETIFGVIPRMNGNRMELKPIIDEIIRMFYCDYEFGTDVICEWMDNRPIMLLSPIEEVEMVFF